MQGKDYTATRNDFQAYMRDGVVGSAAEVDDWVKRSATDSFYMIHNEKRFEYDDYVKFLKDVRPKTESYDPKVHEFLRDGNQLAARTTGEMKLAGMLVSTEVFLFATVGEDGRFTSLIERGVASPVEKEPKTH